MSIKRELDLLPARRKNLLIAIFQHVHQSFAKQIPPIQRETLSVCYSVAL